MNIECIDCHTVLLPSSRERGDGRCGPCSRRHAGAETRADKARAVFAKISAILGAHVFRAVDEASLQNMVTSALSNNRVSCQREVIADARSRYDLLTSIDDLLVVLELKMRGGAASVERQAQRYALMKDVDAVCVATTSARLASQLPDETLGGKPFRAIALRTM
jgi:hypothetical protein